MPPNSVKNFHVGRSKPGATRKKGSPGFFKKWAGKLHLWLGLTSGLIVFVVAITGSIFVFRDEIRHALLKDLRYVEAHGSPLPVDQLWQNTQQHIPGNYKLSWVNVNNNPDRSWEFCCYKADPDAITYFGSLDYYVRYYVNPYTGKILGSVDEEHEFFNVVKMLHWSLLLSTDYGQPIVGWSTFIFVVMLITGIILWWPKNKAAARQRFWFRWKSITKWKRKNYDLHNIPGFYLLIPLFIIACTGLAFAFRWFQALIYVAFAGTTIHPALPETHSISHTIEAVQPMDSAFISARDHYPKAAAFQISPPGDSDTSGVINVYVQQKEDRYYKMQTMKFDQYNGKLLLNKSYDSKNLGEKVLDANYDIHVGAILGLPGKILAFLASTICASLPITGFLIWYGRKFKKRKVRS